MESESPSSADQTHVQIVVDDEAPVPLYLHESALSPGEFKCYLDYFKLLSRSLDAGDSGKPLRNRVVELGRLRGYLQCFFRNISPDDILQCLGLRTEEHDCLDFNKFLAFFRFLLHTANGEKLTKTLLCVQPSAMDEFPCEMDERPLWLHRTALTQREEEEYIEPFRCLSNCSTSFSASNLDSITLSLSVVHGYSQARFRDIEGLDEVLLKFSPGGIKELNLGQFLAAMRLLVHKCNGEMNSNSMAFIQPSSTSAAFTQHALAPDSSGGIPLRQILDLGLGTEERWNAADDGMHRVPDMGHNKESIIIPIFSSDNTTICLEGLEVVELSSDGDLLYPKGGDGDDNVQQLSAGLDSTQSLLDNPITPFERLDDFDALPGQDLAERSTFFRRDALEFSQRQSSSSTLVEDNLSAVNDVVLEERANPLREGGAGLNSMVESISSDISICDTPTRKRRRSERTVGHAPEIASPSKKSNSGTSKVPLKVILRVNKKKGDDVSNTVECEEPLKLSGLFPLNSSPCQACALNNRPCRPHSKLAKACSECKKRKNKCSLASEVASAGESIVVTRSPLPKKSKGARKGTA